MKTRFVQCDLGPSVRSSRKPQVHFSCSLSRPVRLGKVYLSVGRMFRLDQKKGSQDPKTVARTQRKLWTPPRVTQYAPKCLSMTPTVKRKGRRGKEFRVQLYKRGKGRGGRKKRRRTKEGR